MNEQLLEVLAEYDHKRWVHLMRRMFSNGIIMETRDHDGEFLMISPDLYARWKWQMNTDYADLPESEKEGNRNIARQILDILEAGYD